MAASRLVLVVGAVTAALALPASSSSRVVPRQTTVDTHGETITVQAGQTATGSVRLEPGVTYHAVITGTARIEYAGTNPVTYELRDAFYCYETNPSNASNACPANGPPIEENVLLDAHYGQGTAGTVCTNPMYPYACDLSLGAENGKPLAYQGSHSYEQDFTVSQPGTLKLSADSACPPGSSRKCVSGSFTVQFAPKQKPHVCKAPWAAASRSTPAPPAHVAKVDEVHVVAVCPDVQFHKGGTPADAWLPLEQDQTLKAGDEISTDPDGQATLAFAGSATVTVSDTTQLKIGSFFTEGGVVKTVILLKMGQIAAQVNKSEATKSDFRIKSPTATISVRGTIFSVFYDPGSHTTVNSTHRGLVLVTPANRRLKPVTVGAGREVAVTPSAKTPVAPIGKAGARGGTDIVTARDLALAVVAKNATACSTRTPRTGATAIRPAGGGWLVTVNLQGAAHGRSLWRISHRRARPANALAWAVASGCR